MFQSFEYHVPSTIFQRERKEVLFKHISRVRESNNERTLLCVHFWETISFNRLMYGFNRDMTNKLFSSLMKLIRPDKIEIDNATASWALDILGYTVEKLMLEVNNFSSILFMKIQLLWIMMKHIVYYVKQDMEIHS